jgi:hypothetical protein
MTIIACTDKVMVADSYSFSDGIQFPCVRPKVSRAPDGSLVGCVGAAVHTDVIHAWVARGMNFKKLPKMSQALEKDERATWLWLRPDGRAFIGDYNFGVYEASTPTNIGLRDACSVWTGAYAVCGDPVLSIRVALIHCVYIGGEPQVEYLNATRDSKRRR